MTTSPVRHPEPEPPERTERAGSVGSRHAPASPAGRVLELQRSAGNRAVTALLARDPKPDAPPAKAPSKGPQYQVKIPDVGTIEVDSWSWSDAGRGPGGHGAGKVTFKELNFSSLMGPHSAALARATVTGTPLGTVVLEATKDGKVYLRITLHEAMITSYQVSGQNNGRANPPESWTLNASKIDFEYLEQPKAESEPASPPG